MNSAKFGDSTAAVEFGYSASRSLAIQRSSVHIDSSTGVLFGWYHHSPDAISRSCAAVICNPLGYEYTHSHRSLRHLADHLARSGVSTLRFDYHGTGDSPGTDLDPDRLTCWQNSIQAAAKKARDLSACKEVCFIGIRMGASLAASIASAINVNLLVLWNPCISGRLYLREMQVIARAANDSTSTSDVPLESGGFQLTAETAQQISAINLLDFDFTSNQRVLILKRDDLAEETLLLSHLISKSVSATQMTIPGYAEMMAEPQFTAVPNLALDVISSWLIAHTHTESRTFNTVEKDDTGLIEFPFVRLDGTNCNLYEKSCRFGADNHLFGIITTKAQTQSPTNTAYVLINSGSVHHVGPNRLYIALARNIAASGASCFRIDIEGLGDSVLRKPGQENHPYTDSAVPDVGSALTYLRDQLGYKRFGLIGLCSGAHAAFHASVDFSEYEIVDTVIINPLTFHWREGMTLETTQHFQDAAYYKKSALNPNSWLKLLRGKVDILNLLRIGLTQLLVSVKARSDALAEGILPGAGTPLSRDLKKLFAHGRSLHMIIAAGDPGYDLLVAGAKGTATKGIKAGKITVSFIPNANHTFSQVKPRNELIHWLSAHVMAASKSKSTHDRKLTQR